MGLWAGSACHTINVLIFIKCATMMQILCNQYSPNWHTLMTQCARNVRWRWQIWHVLKQFLLIQINVVIDFDQIVIIETAGRKPLESWNQFWSDGSIPLESTVLEYVAEHRVLLRNSPGELSNWHEADYRIIHKKSSNEATNKKRRFHRC